MKICKCGELKLYFFFEIVRTATVVVGSTLIEIIKVLIKPKSINNISLPCSTTPIHSSSKPI